MRAAEGQTFRTLVAETEVIPSERGAELVAAYGVAADAPLSALLQRAAQANFLYRGLKRHQAWVSDRLGAAPGDVLEELCAPVDGSSEAVATALRLAKSQLSLWAALCDLGQVWALSEVTAALTRFADHTVEMMLRAFVREAVARGDLPEGTALHGHLSALAMGKMGAQELNYSSDIDLVVLIGDAAPVALHPVLVKITRRVAAALSKVTADGYVFRTDLRLRPDAATTPVAVPMAAARRYYRDHGRTWERAAYIKARACAGDIAAGAAFLLELQPWVFRRHLDFPAIEDAYEMLRAIRTHKGLSGPITVPGHDIKLGRGGIREIEFFAQTRQLISAGRDPRLRAPRTQAALARLAQAGWVDDADAQVLSEIYTRHRDREHRVQMLEDAQTHVIPTNDALRGGVAALSGQSLAAFDAALRADLEAVHRIVGQALSVGGEVESAPEAAQELDVIARWRSLPVARSERARQVFDRVAPRLQAAMASYAKPQAAEQGLDRFISGLSAGVQVLSSLEAAPEALELLMDITARAPRLATELARRPATFDVAFLPGFGGALPDLEGYRAQARAMLSDCRDLEQSLDALRRFAREARFQVEVQLLRGAVSDAAAARALSDIADVVVAKTLPPVIDDMALRHGPPPGQGLAVIGMGKLGTREMTAASDLDLILVYDAGEGAESAGPRPLAPTAYFARLTRALTNALTVPTAEGSLYEVDMRLRPSGRQGPVAVPLNGFRRYQLEEAWTWEHLALTRARVVAGPETLKAAIEGVLADVRHKPREAAVILADVSEMRQRLAEATGAPGPLDLKHGPGRLLDIDLVLQAGLLCLGSDAQARGRGFAALAEAGWLSPEGAEVLTQARALMMRTQALVRVVVSSERMPEGFVAQSLAESLGFAEFDAVLAAIESCAAEAARVIEDRLG
ncbi:MAG: glutamine-synthetase adenylyltransferase [Pseudomonadota bacterium]